MYSTLDSCSLSDSSLYRPRHVDLVNSNKYPITQKNQSNHRNLSIKQNWNVDFDNREIQGSATHSVQVLVDGTDVIRFDSSNLRISNVFVNDVEATFTVGEKVVPLGQAISVSIPLSLQASGTDISIRFDYVAGVDSSAIQWLDSSATSGGQYPFLFTQCQAIHARSLLPCFDSPGVKCTYSATVRAPGWATGEPRVWLSVIWPVVITFGVNLISLDERFVGWR